MELIFIFLLAGVIIFLGFFGEIIFKKTNIPDVLFLILFGIFIGRVLKWVDPTKLQSAPVIFTTFALVFILFEGALNIDIEKLVKEMCHGATITILNFIISATAITVILRLLGFSWANGILLGVILGDMSSEVIIPMIKNLSLRQNVALTLTIESAISDVLCIVGALTVIQIVALKSFTWGSFFNNIFGSFAISLLIGLVLGLLWVFFLRAIKNVMKSYMITIASMLLVYVLAEAFNYNGEIACLAFGLVLGNSRKIFTLFKKEDCAFAIDTNQKFFFSQITFFVKTFFFVYLGLLMNFTDLKLIAIGALIAAVLFLVRPLTVYLTFRKNIISHDRAILESVVPKGLAAAVLAQLPLQYGIEGAESFSTIILTVIFASIAFSAVLVFVVQEEWFNGLGEVYANIFAWVRKKAKRKFAKLFKIDKKGSEEKEYYSPKKFNIKIRKRF